MQSPYHGVFFDLDGTLADTAPDLVAAANQLLIARKRAALPYEVLRPLKPSSKIVSVILCIGCKVAMQFQSFKTSRDFLIDPSSRLALTHFYSELSVAELFSLGGITFF